MKSVLEVNEMKKFLALLLACAVVLGIGVVACGENTEGDFITPVVPIEKVETYDADDQLIAEVPEEEITQLAVSEADKLPPEAKDKLLNCYAYASSMQDEMVQYCFWLDAPEEYKPENLGWVMLQFRCPGSGVKVYFNSEEVPVYYIGGMTYYTKLPEFGAVAINVEKKEGIGDAYTYKVPGDNLPSSTAPTGGGIAEETFTTRVAPAKKMFEICDKNDKTIKLVPYEMVIEVQVTQGDRLQPDEQDTFTKAYDEAKAIEDRVVKYFFWLDVPEDYIPADFAYGKFEFNCAGDNVEAFVNGKPMVVVHESGDDYYAKLTEFGPVMIVCD